MSETRPSIVAAIIVRDGRTRDWAPLTFAAELPDVQGAVLVVRTDVARPDNWIGSRSAVIHPAQVAACVRAALRGGWQPAQPVPAFLADVAQAAA